MLTAAAIGMAGYGLYEIGWALFDVLSVRQLEIWADLVSVVFGVLLALAAAFVRVQLPGGLALAMGACLGLQAFALHSSAHFYGRVVVLPQLIRGTFALLLVALAYVGAKETQGRE